MRRFLLHSKPFRLGLATTASAVRSTGYDRRTGGHVHQVDGCVVVPIMDHAAVVARPFPVRRASGRRGYGRNREHVLLDGIPRGLPPQYAAPCIAALYSICRRELEHADIGDGCAKLAVRHHATHVQVLDADDIELRTISVVALCSASFRTLAIRACSRASFAADLRRLAEPLTLRLWARLRRRSVFRFLRSAFGPSMACRRSVLREP